MTLSDQIDAAIAEGRGDAVLIEWAQEASLFRGMQATPEGSIRVAKDELVENGWTWNFTDHQFERDGWKVWFRSQGLLSPPICQWSKVEKSRDL